MRRPSLSLLVLAVVIAAILSLGACNTEKPAADTRAADEAAIRAASKAWSDAAQAKDIAKVMSFYAPDAVAFPDREPIARGSVLIQNEWQGVLAVPGPGISWTTTAVDVAKAGDMASEYGAYQFLSTDKAGKTETTNGKYLLVWKKQADGTWKVSRDIDNQDMPPAPAAAAAHSAHHAAKKHHKHH
jgi:uncharacterized protein (TIGR02246 family)